MIRAGDELTTTPFTEAQVLAMIAKINIKIHNICFPTGDMEDDILAGVDYEENGDVGHKMNPTALLTALRAERQDLIKMLKDPSAFGDAVAEVSQWDIPDL